MPPRLPLPSLRSGLQRPPPFPRARFESSTSLTPTPSPSPWGQPVRARRRLLTPTTLILGFIPIFTFSLGVWQIKRLKWKVALIDELNDKLEREPMSLPPNVDTSALPEFQYRRVLLHGRFLPQRFLVVPRVRENVHGAYLVQALARPGGATVLVNRGFVSSEHYDTFHTPEGDTEVLGMLRVAQTRNMFTPENKPEKGEWFWVDPEGMAAAAGGSERGVQAVLVDEIFDGNAGEADYRVKNGVPVGRPPKIELRNQHAVYAATWFSLSAATTGLFFLLLRRTPHARRPLMAK